MGISVFYGGLPEQPTQSSLDRLWALIGEGGCRLTTEENAQLIQFLSVVLIWTSNSTYSIAEAFEQFDDNYQLLLFDGTATPINDYEDFYAAFNIPLSRKEAWEAIKAIASHELTFLPLHQ